MAISISTACWTAPSRWGSREPAGSTPAGGSGQPSAARGAEIAATVRLGQFADGSVARDPDFYLFVVTGGGEISSGFPIGPPADGLEQTFIMGPGAPTPVTSDTAAVDSP
jgi:hypothetical protein